MPELSIFRQRIAIGATVEGPFRELDAVVDTGSLYTWVPGHVLWELGVVPTETRRFILANGERIDTQIAWVTVRVDGQVAPTICVFGDEGTAPLLGVFTLEGFALAADPVNHRLVPMESLPLL